MDLNVPSEGRKRIVIAGGGFAGIQLIKKLAKLDMQIVLIDKNNHHMFQPLLYQVATAALNPSDIAFPFRRLYRKKKNVVFRMAEIREVRPEDNIVITDKGDLHYDYFVLATGATTNFFGMESIEKESMPMKELSEALAIRNRILENVENAVFVTDPEVREGMLTVVIVGGGPTGVELAGAFGEIKKHIMPSDYHEKTKYNITIYLIEGGPHLLPAMSDKTSEETARLLAKMGIEVKLNSVVSGYEDGYAILKNGEKIRTDNLIWASGVKVDLPKGLEQSRRTNNGRIITDTTFRVAPFGNLYAIGDVSAQLSGEYPNGYPQLARVGMEQADNLAGNIKRQMKGMPEKQFSYRVYPVLATVGRNHAFAEYKGYRLNGFIGWASWAVIHLWLILGINKKLNIFMEWLWNYMTFDHPTRLIVREKQRKETVSSRINDTMGC